MGIEWDNMARSALEDLLMAGLGIQVRLGGLDYHQFSVLCQVNGIIAP